MATPRRRARSPSYPAFGLREAVAKVAAAEKSHGTLPVERVDAAKALGYTSLSGSAIQALSTLTAYGLIERRGKGQVAVTDLSMAILYAESEDERSEGIQQAVLLPPLFSQLRERYPGFAPPGENVTNHLRRAGFTEGAAKVATQSYLDSICLVGIAGDSDRYDDRLAEWQGSVGAAEEYAGRETGMEDRGMSEARRLAPAGAGSDYVEWMRLPVSETATVRILVRGSLGASEFEVMTRALDLQRQIFTGSREHASAAVDQSA